MGEYGVFCSKFLHVRYLHSMIFIANSVFVFVNFAMPVFFCFSTAQSTRVQGRISLEEAEMLWKMTQEREKVGESWGGDT